MRQALDTAGRFTTMTMAVTTMACYVAVAAIAAVTTHTEEEGEAKEEEALP
jgi:hypothetical protein